MTIIWSMVPEIWSMTDRIFCHFGLLPFYPYNKSKNQNFEKLKKTTGDIILHDCTKNQDHMLYCSWDIDRDGCTYFLVWAIFCPFTSLTAQKSEFKKKFKKCLEISSFHTSAPKIIIICYTVPETWCDRCNCYFSFWAIFCPFTPLTAQKIKILKKWKKHLEISSFIMSVPKIMIRGCTVPEMMRNRQTDRQTEKVTYRGGCPT